MFHNKLCGRGSSNCSDEVGLRLGIFLLTVTWLTRDVRFFSEPVLFCLYIAVHHFIWSHCIWGMLALECAADKSAATATACPFLANVSLSNEERLQQPAGFLFFFFHLFHQRGSERGKQGPTERQTPNLHQTVSTHWTLEHYLIFIGVLILLSTVLVLRPRSPFPKEFAAESGGSGELWWRAAGHRRNRAQRSATVQHRVSLGAGPQDVAPAQVGKCTTASCASHFQSDDDEKLASHLA